MSTLVVEDDGATRAYLLDALNRIAALQPVNFAVDVASGMRALERYRPKLMLVDLGLPDGEGTQLIALAAKMEPRPEVLVISSLGDESHVVRALEAGALLADLTFQRPLLHRLPPDRFLRLPPHNGNAPHG